MRIPINFKSDIPLYQQIETYLRQGILSGNLPSGVQLPASRQLCQEIGVSRVTVENAYSILESDGLVTRRSGSGTYVLSPDTHQSSPYPSKSPSWPLWQQELQMDHPASAPSGAASRSELRQHPVPIEFTGFGDARRFPCKDFYRAVREVMNRDGVAALQVAEPGGYAPLRETIAQLLSSQGIQARPESILITSGSQQALGLISQILLKPGDSILVESPTYNTALELFTAQKIKLIGCPIDADGLQVGSVETLLQQHHPKLIYTIPTFQNPSGACLSSIRRRQLIALANCYNIPILEDDFAGELCYDGRALPALKALDLNGNVIYVGTFSKILMPGLRIGFIAADGPIYDRLVFQKQIFDLATSTLMQRALDVYVTIGRYQAHVHRSCQVYRRRRDAILAAIQQYLPSDTLVDPPKGGLFVWLEMPDGISTSQLLPLALEEGVVYAPGTRFFPDPARGDRYLRLNFATQTPDEIQEGIRRLARAIRRLRK